MLARKGITSTAAVLGLTLTAMSGPPATVEIIAKVAAQALAHSGGASSVSMVASALLPVTALVVGGLLVGSQLNLNQQLRADVAQLTFANQEIATIQAENRLLVSRIAEIETTPRASIPVPPPTSTSIPVVTSAALPPTGAIVTLTKAGTIMWEGDRVRLEEFLSRLQKLQADDPQSRITIRGGENDRFSMAAYMVEEVRKSQIAHVTLESTTPPDPNRPESWF